MTTTPQHVILFDGVCNFCNWSVQFVMKRDPERKFYFASLQSDTGQALLERFGLANQNIDSVVYINGDKAYIKSKAAFRILRQMSGPVRLLSIFGWIPTFVTDFFYDLFASNRYKMFGRSEHCMIPTKEQRAQFLS